MNKIKNKTHIKVWTNKTIFGTNDDNYIQPQPTDAMVFSSSNHGEYVINSVKVLDLIYTNQLHPLDYSEYRIRLYTKYVDWKQSI